MVGHHLNKVISKWRTEEGKAGGEKISSYFHSQGGREGGRENLDVCNAKSWLQTSPRFISEVLIVHLLIGPGRHCKQHNKQRKYTTHSSVRMRQETLKGNKVVFYSTSQWEKVCQIVKHLILKRHIWNKKGNSKWFCNHNCIYKRESSKKSIVENINHRKKN